MANRQLITAESVHIEISITEYQAWALAQFLKRVGWSEMRTCAVNEEETYEIRSALSALRRAVNEAGFDPR